MQYSVVHAFANPVRLKILCCLSKGQKNVAEIISTCKLEQSAVSQHLSKLRRAGLVKSTRDGRFIYYRLARPKAAELAKSIETFVKEAK